VGVFFALNSITMHAVGEKRFSKAFQYFLGAKNQPTNQPFWINSVLYLCWYKIDCLTLVLFSLAGAWKELIHFCLIWDGSLQKVLFRFFCALCSITIQTPTLHPRFFMRKRHFGVINFVDELLHKFLKQRQQFFICFVFSFKWENSFWDIN